MACWPTTNYPNRQTCQMHPVPNRSLTPIIIHSSFQRNKRETIRKGTYAKTTRNHQLQLNRNGETLPRISQALQTMLSANDQVCLKNKKLVRRNWIVHSLTKGPKNNYYSTLLPSRKTRERIPNNILTERVLEKRPKVIYQPPRTPKKVNCQRPENFHPVVLASTSLR